MRQMSLFALLFAAAAGAPGATDSHYEFVGSRWIIFHENATDEDMHILDSHRDVTVVAVAGKSVTDAGLLPLAGCLRLDTLSVTSPLATEDGLRPIRELPKLDRFCAGRTTWTMVKNLPRSVTELDLEDNSLMGDDALSQVGELPHLRRLSFYHSPIGDAGLGHLGLFPELTSLSLRDTRLSDAGLIPIGHLGRLVELDLRESRVTDAGIPSLRAMTALEELDLSQTQITGRGLKSLAGLEKLGVIRLDDSSVDDAGASAVATLPFATYLSLSHCKLTDSAATALAGMPRLQRLNLAGCAITDAGVHSLQQSRSLRFVDLIGSKVSEDAAKAASSESLTVRVHPRSTTEPMLQ